MSRLSKLFLMAALLVCLVPGHARAQRSDPVIEPGPEQIPEWLQQGRFRFARLDGGPIEVQKTTRSAWGNRFTAQETDVLGNLYGKYADTIADELGKAGINFVWVTYSVGFSWGDEAGQRAAVRVLTRKLHERGIKVAAYMCAVSVFWESMFRDVPESVKWIRFDARGVPFRYSGGRDPLRFIADLDQPGWVEYQKKRVGAIIDDGLDAIFFDNTGGPGWASNESVARFFREIRSFIHHEKRSNIPLFTNYGLAPSRAMLNRYMEFTFNEGWREPGVWGGEWEVSNVRRFRLTRGEIPPWKPLVTEYSIFHQGDRASGFLPAHSEKLAIAEAAAFGGAYTWDMEGPFVERLVAQDPKALDSWAAIGEYNDFLKNHEALYVGAKNVTPLLVVVPEDYPIDFGWDKEPSPLFDFLAKKSVLFEVKAAAHLTSADLHRFDAIVLLSPGSLTAEQKGLIRNYRAAGGGIGVVGAGPERAGLEVRASLPEIPADLLANAQVQTQVLSKLKSLAPEAPWIELGGAEHVLANLTSVRGGREVVLHLLNYAPKPAAGVRLTLSLGTKFAAMAGKEPIVISPDGKSAPLDNVRWKGATLEATVPSLPVYSALVLK